MADSPGSNGNGRPRSNGRPSAMPIRILGSAAGGARRVVGATGLDRAVESVAEEAIVRAIESPAAERALIRVLEGPAVDEAVGAALESPAIERAVDATLDSEMVDRIWERLLASDETQKLIERIAEAPELRAAVAAQSIGVLGDLVQQVRAVAQRLDSGVERIARAIFRRSKRAEIPPQAGAVTRVVALALDAAILNGLFLVVSGLLALAASLIVPGSGFVLAVGATAWAAAGILYLLAFWATSGETPGMRLMGIRLLREGTSEIGGWPALKRLIGVGLSVITLGLGFLPILFTKRRRGWPDRIADTEVVYVDWEGASPSPAVEGRG